jgi:hypothetical protein
MVSAATTTCCPSSILLISRGSLGGNVAQPFTRVWYFGGAPVRLLTPTVVLYRGVKVCHTSGRQRGQWKPQYPNQGAAPTAIFFALVGFGVFARAVWMCLAAGSSRTLHPFHRYFENRRFRSLDKCRFRVHSKRTGCGAENELADPPAVQI